MSANTRAHKVATPEKGPWNAQDEAAVFDDSGRSMRY